MLTSFWRSRSFCWGQIMIGLVNRVETSIRAAGQTFRMRILSSASLPVQDQVQEMSVFTERGTYAEGNLLTSFSLATQLNQPWLTRLFGLIRLVSTFLSAVILFTDSWASFNLKKQTNPKTKKHWVKFIGLIGLIKLWHMYGKKS